MIDLEKYKILGKYEKTLSLGFFIFVLLFGAYVIIYSSIVEMLELPSPSGIVLFFGNFVGWFLIALSMFLGVFLFFHISLEIVIRLRIMFYH